ncbi:hypothetical protein MSG28_004890 [Choristoneura fumiferana]|uniref:Uncharacterized protein n=1 Tax=Choristoneura fumiferana TaxID=7141 RepID=A0ACC0JP05_CHOFU|nr:hypothetical protein MSG28_004890 [Choristoneura fumiferana]
MHSRNCSPFVECSSSSVGDEVATTSKKKVKPPKDNFGSEESEDSEDDEAGLPVIPRALRAIMETPEDDVTGIEESPRQLSQPPYEPGAFLDFKWSSFANPPTLSYLRRKSVSYGNTGPTAAYTDPYVIFINIWDRQFMEHIVAETNKYAQLLAQQLFLNNKLGPTSISDWKDTTVDELYVFFALTIAMGIVAKGRLVDYWNANSRIFITPGFRVYTPLRRYQLLWQCLHFRDNKDISTKNLSVSEAKLFKIHPVLDHLNGHFQSMYNLQQNIALDESLLLLKGWLDSNQCFPNKAAATGIKTYEVCEPQTSYLRRFAVHVHKRTKNAIPNSDSLEAYFPSVVLKLLRGLENRGHTVWMDNFYNSPALARKLKSLRFDCVGTLRTNRQFVPQLLRSP